MSFDTIRERRGSAVVSTSACHAGGPGSLPGPGTFRLLGLKSGLSTLEIVYRPHLCLSDETLKSCWSLLPCVYARGR